jgi:hypothetical protein
LRPNFFCVIFLDRFHDSLFYLLLSEKEKQTKPRIALKKTKKQKKRKLEKKLKQIETN